MIVRNLTTLIAYLINSLTRSNAMPHNYSRIFLLSHMRAYTSLLGHIFGSHPEINGYYEMHLSYESEKDLECQEQQYTEQEKLKPGSRFLFDKLLHNDYEFELEQLKLDGEVILLSLRQPEQTIKSIINLFAKKNTKDPYSFPAEATKYYIERLKKLSEFGKQYPQSYYYFDAELIRSDSQQMLAVLSQWLKLGSLLSDRYQQFSKTGVAGAGDSSQAISSGKVIKQENQYPDISLEFDLLQQVVLAYQDCRQQLINNAIEEAIMG